MKPERLDDIADAPSRDRIMHLHPAIRQRAVDAFLAAVAALSGKNSLRITYGLRTFEQQHNIWLKCHRPDGQRIPGAPWTTNADAGQSYHNYGLAIDFCLIHEDGRVSFSLKEDLDADGIADWAEVASAFKAAGFAWGGEWDHKDNPHVEIIPLEIQRYADARKIRPWKRLLELHKEGELDADGYVFLRPF